MSERRDITCCFTGHRHIKSENLPKLIELLDFELGWLTSHGVIEFITGGALGFDTLAALAVLKAKKSDGRLRLNLALPCHDQTRNWKPRDIATYNYILSEADSSIFLSENYHAGAMHIRNRYMVDNSRYCVCYYDSLTAASGHGKGTRSTVSYARSRGLTLINLLDVPPDDGQLQLSSFF